MAYEIKISRAAEKEINELQKIYYLPVRNAILNLADNPCTHDVKKLKGFKDT